MKKLYCPSQQLVERAQMEHTVSSPYIAKNDFLKHISKVYQGNVKAWNLDLMQWVWVVFSWIQTLFYYYAPEETFQQAVIWY